MKTDQFVVKKIETAVPGAIEEVADFRAERTIFVKKDQLKAVCQFLRDDEELQYNFYLIFVQMICFLSFPALL